MQKKKKRTKGSEFVWSRKQDEGNMVKMSEKDNNCSSMYKGKEKEILLTAKVKAGEVFQQGGETTEDII